ncbi:MAG: hypothetical protein ACYTAN_00065 [Planctomycetota bacterium]|jgi:hypothetical protein
MTVRRLIICMSAVVAVCIVNICHHALCVKQGYELGRVQAESARLKVAVATLEGNVAMLAHPARLRAENERMQLALVDPGNWRDADRALAMAEFAEAPQGDFFDR